MLARIGEIDGVRTPQTDSGGDHLRFEARDEAVVDAVIREIERQGYGGVRIADAGAQRWFDVASVGELSRVEAGVIADRVLAQIALVDPRTVRPAIVTALHEAFVANALDAGRSGADFRAECVRRTVDAAAAVVGVEQATAIGRLLDTDMRRVHKT